MPENKQQEKTRQQKIEEFLLDPQKATFETLEAFEAAVSELLDLLSAINVDSLEKIQGKDGVTPVYGKDYMTEEDLQKIQAFIISKIPKLGVDLPTVQQVKGYIEDAVAKIPRVQGPKGNDGAPGQKGADGSPDTGEEILQKIRSVKKNQMLKIGDIRGLKNMLAELVAGVDSIDELRKKFDNFVQIIPMQQGGDGGIGNDATAIHTDGVDEFADITEDSSPEAGAFFIYEATDGTKYKIAFSDIGSGADGRTVLNGTVDPTTEGVNGDFYYRTDTQVMFGPKAGGVWPAGVSLKGDDGADGTNGTDGADGRTILSGTAAPTTEGVDGDFYIRTTTQFIYGPKAGGVWPAGVDLNGTDGADGADGADGESPTAANVGAINAAATSKTTPIDADSFPIVDSAASNVIKRVTFTNLKAFLKTYIDAMTSTFTNKTMIATTNVVEQITTTASSSTPAPTGGSLRNFFTVTALAANATISAPSGTPANGNKLFIRIKDNGTARTLAYNSIFRAIGVTLPTTTVLGKTLYLGCIYNSADSKWDVIAVAQEA